MLTENFEFVRLISSHGKKLLDSLSFKSFVGSFGKFEKNVCYKIHGISGKKWNFSEVRYFCKPSIRKRWQNQPF